MYKHAPNRTQKSTGLKAKQVLQICVLVAVCFWLIYQVKHFHDKKKTLEENDSITSIETDSHGLKIGGRKDLLDPLKEQPLTTTEKKDEEEEEETEEENVVEEIDNKEEEQEEDDKNEKIVDEIDVGDEERDKEELNENEEEEKDDTSQVEDHGHEAREVQYKGDDASSAVTHDSESVSSETERIILENRVGERDKDGLRDRDSADNTAVKEEEEYEILSSKQDENLILSTTTEETDNQEDDVAMKSGKAKQDADSNPIDTQNLETDVSENRETEENGEENGNEVLELEKETGESESGDGQLGHHDPIDDSDSLNSLEKEESKL